MEIWAKIKFTNEKYEVSSCGKVRSLNYLGHNKTEELSLSKDNKGYLRVRLFCEDGKRRTFKVHRLVAEAFIENPKNKLYVNHKDGDKTNNIIENLEWVTASENVKHAYEIGLNEKKRELCRAMGAMYAKNICGTNKTSVIAFRITDGTTIIYESQKQASLALSIPQGNINKVLKGKRKSAKGYRFEYNRR